ncbi:glucose transporter type 1-like [Sabethes cyaneus]|uniref:glucose transporter type 1-like n=1 Tax=Sabethes cyaneus TaxID=53552 RepID=UPI00237EB256|nr:glucose transporter type 1-like [Sabethes cyaneus]
MPSQMVDTENGSARPQTAASERCSENARNTQMRTATCAPHHHHQQYVSIEHAEDDDDDGTGGDSQHQSSKPSSQTHHHHHHSCSSRSTTPGMSRRFADGLGRSRTSLRSEAASSLGGGHSHHHHHHHHRRQASSTSSNSFHARQTRTDDDETAEEEVAGTTATCTEDERHPESASTMYVENCHCSRGNLTTTDDDEEIQQYFVVNRSVSRRPSTVSCTSRVSHRSNRSTPRSGGSRSKRGTPLSGVSCCSHHSHHSQQTYRSRGGHDSPSFLHDSGSNATISNFNINPARFQCSYYTADESENSYCSISGENIRQIQTQTQIQSALEMKQIEDNKRRQFLEKKREHLPRLQPLPLPPADGSDYNDSQQENSINGSILSIIESTSSDQPGGSTTTSTTTSTTQRQLQQVGERGAKKGTAGSQMILTPSKITIENIGQLSEIAAKDYDFDDIDVNIPELFHSPSKIKWNFLAGLDESKSNKSRISSISSLVDAGSSGRGRSGTESGGADVSETASERRRYDSSDNDYSPNRIQQQPLPPIPVSTPPPQSSSNCKIEELLKKSSPSASAEFKTVSIWRAENGDEANAIIFHHESEIVENCCTNHFLDHSNYDICTVDNCDYLIKSTDTPKSDRKGSFSKSEERLNNSVALTTSTGTKLELKQRNVFTSTLSTANNATAAANVYSIISPDLRRFEKQTNLTRNSVNLSQNLSSASSTSSSSIFLGNYNQIYRNMNQNTSDDKLLNTSSSKSRLHPTSRSTTSINNVNTVTNNTATSTLDPNSDNRQRLGSSVSLNQQPPFSITSSTATAAAASQFYNKSYHLNLTAQNRLYFHAYSNLVREQEQCQHHSPSPAQSEQSNGGQQQPCAQCQELYGCPLYYSSNATNEDSAGGGTFNDITNTSSSASLTGSGTGRRGLGSRSGTARWRRNVSHSLRINGLVRVVRTRARKCADYIRQKEHQSNSRFHRRK